jgi:hypothetical protein
MDRYTKWYGMVWYDDMIYDIHGWVKKWVVKREIIIKNVQNQ